MSGVKPKPIIKVLWPMTTDADDPMNQSEFEQNTRAGRQERENERE